MNAPREWITEYANRADDGAPYCGPVLLASSSDDARTLLEWVKGPNGEELILVGELVYREPPDVIGDTHSVVRKL